MPTIAVLDYGIGNLRSAQKALERAGADAILTAETEAVKKADGVVLPGVGNFGTCIEALRTTGVDQMALDAIESRRPFLGICIGMQLLFEESEEFGKYKGLGILKGNIKSLKKIKDNFQVPNIGWHYLKRNRMLNNNKLIKFDKKKYVYFIHSYFADPKSEKIISSYIDIKSK